MRRPLSYWLMWLMAIPDMGIPAKLIHRGGAEEALRVAHMAIDITLRAPRSRIPLLGGKSFI